MSAAGATKPLSIGLELPCPADLSASLDSAISTGFDFVLAPLFHPRLRRDACGVSARRQGAGTRSDLALSGARWSTCVVGAMSGWLAPDSAVPAARRAAEAAFKVEAAWASHLSLPAVLAPPPPPGAPAAALAALLQQATSACASLHFWLPFPLAAYEGAEPAELAGGGGGGARDWRDPWEAWNAIRTLADCSGQLSIALRLGATLPANAEAALTRWLGEPLRAALLPTAAFSPNRRGFPTLPAAYQLALRRLHARGVQLVLTGRPAECRGEAGQLLYAEAPHRPYYLYLQHVLAPEAAAAAAAASGGGAPQAQSEAEAAYNDFLQVPLQPLADNLESCTYETFERDPAKYDAYEAAVRSALLAAPAPAAGGPPPPPLRIVVVGAGRGPLVTRALRAAAAAGRAVRVLAVEKNPNAVVTLRSLAAEDAAWRAAGVEVVAGDMRAWAAGARGSADVLVSELLGSFGDNELSPECLDGALPCLAAGGVSIPSRYTSHLQPVMSAKLWGRVRALGADAKWFETPFVVRMVSFAPLAPPAPVFTFEHAAPGAAGGSGGADGGGGGGGGGDGAAPDNRRYAALRFTAAAAGVVHGLAGYFDAALHGEATLSTHPETHTPGMASWFPLFFPLRNPVYVRAGGAIEVHIWRRVAPARVWYEWALTEPDITHVHNTGGRSYFVGL